MEAFIAFKEFLLVFASGLLTIGYIIGFLIGAKFGKPYVKKDEQH